MAKEFKKTIEFKRKMIFSETSIGIQDKAFNVVLQANVSVFKNQKDEWQGSCESYAIKPDDLADDWYMDCWIGFEGTMAVDYDGTSGYLPDEVLDLIDKNGFNTDDIRPEKSPGWRN